MMFPPNVIHGPHAPRPVAPSLYPYGAIPQPQQPAPDVPLHVFKAAQAAGASHLSADGLRAYRDDRGGVEVAFWNDDDRVFPSWWPCDELPGDAVRME